jgi:multiple sugar transport system permease protein
MSFSTLSLKPARKPQWRGLRYDQVFGLLLISPWLIGLVLFKLLPILASFGISFTNFHMLKPQETQFVGLDNYAQIFQDDTVGFLLFRTLAPALTNIPLQIGASIFLAACLNSRQLKGRTALRTLFFLPSIIPGVAILFMWTGFTDPDSGWLNRLILEPLGLTQFGGLYEQAALQLLNGLRSLWSIGPGMLILLNALQGVSPEMHEAARVDGAGPLERFFFISLPLVSPAIFFTLVINLITTFGGVILLDRGNTFSGGASPYDRYISHMMFDEFQLGYASSLAWVFFAVVLIGVLILLSTSRQWVYYPDRES